MQLCACSKRKCKRQGCYANAGDAGITKNPQNVGVDRNGTASKTHENAR
jgi:hypothetical protein